MLIPVKRKALRSPGWPMAHQIPEQWTGRDRRMEMGSRLDWESVSATAE